MLYLCLRALTDWYIKVLFCLQTGSRNDQPTLEALDKRYQSNMGQRVTLSFLDVKAINMAYCQGKIINIKRDEPVWVQYYTLYILIKVKVQVYRISSLEDISLYLTPWSLDLFIQVPFQLHSEHSESS